METDLKPSEKDIRTVLEAHSLLPGGPLLDEALGLVSLYEDRIRQVLGELPTSVNRQKAILAVLEEGFMQEGIIPNSDKRIFLMPAGSKEP